MHMENRPFPPLNLPQYPQHGVACPCQCHTSRARYPQVRGSCDARNRPSLCTRAALLPPCSGSSTTDTALKLGGLRVVYISCCKQHGLLLLAY